MLCLHCAFHSVVSQQSKPFPVIRKDSRYTEKDAAKVVRQMLKVAAECHLHGLVHRDMKPEVFVWHQTANLVSVLSSQFSLHTFLAEFSFQVTEGRFALEGYRFWSL